METGRDAGCVLTSASSAVGVAGERGREEGCSCSLQSRGDSKLAVRSGAAGKLRAGSPPEPREQRRQEPGLDALQGRGPLFMVGVMTLERDTRTHAHMHARTLHLRSEAGCVCSGSWSAPGRTHGVFVLLHQHLLRRRRRRHQHQHQHQHQHHPGTSFSSQLDVAATAEGPGRGEPLLPCRRPLCAPQQPGQACPGIH